MVLFCGVFPLGFKVRDYSSWASEMLREMEMGEKIRDISTSGLKINQHQQLLAEIEVHDEIYERVSQLGQELLLEQKMSRTDVCVPNFIMFPRLHMELIRSSPSLFQIATFICVPPLENKEKKREHGAPQRRNLFLNYCSPFIRRLSANNISRRGFLKCWFCALL